VKLKQLLVFHQGGPQNRPPLSGHKRLLRSVITKPVQLMRYAVRMVGHLWLIKLCEKDCSAAHMAALRLGRVRMREHRDSNSTSMASVAGSLLVMKFFFMRVTVVFILFVML
jgi:hypothetical protein